MRNENHYTTIKILITLSITTLQSTHRRKNIMGQVQIRKNQSYSHQHQTQFTPYTTHQNQNYHERLPQQPRVLSQMLTPWSSSNHCHPHWSQKIVQSWRLCPCCWNKRKSSDPGRRLTPDKPWKKEISLRSILNSLIILPQKIRLSHKTLPLKILGNLLRKRLHKSSR